MGTNRYDGVLNDYAIKLIKTMARQLTRHHGFSSSDQDDIEQELAIRLLERLPKFDPEKASLDTFINRVVVHLVATMIRDQIRMKRGIESTVYLEDPVSNPNGVRLTLLDTLDHDGFLLKTGSTSRSMEDQHAVRVDTETLLDLLPEEMQNLCRQLMEASIPEIAEALGLHRTTVNWRVGEIRKRLKEQGLSDPREG